MMVPDPQPAKAVLVMRRIQQSDVAAKIPCSRTWLYRVLNGYVEPSERIRRRMSYLLDLPEDELFRPRPATERRHRLAS